MRLDALFNALWSGAMGGDESKIDMIIKIMETRAKIWGLDAYKMRSG